MRQKPSAAEHVGCLGCCVGFGGKHGARRCDAVRIGVGDTERKRRLLAVLVLVFVLVRGVVVGRVEVSADVECCSHFCVER